MSARPMLWGPTLRPVTACAWRSSSYATRSSSLLRFSPARSWPTTISQPPCLQELLGRLNDLAVAGGAGCRSAARPQGSGYQALAGGKSESLLPEFSLRLTDFQQQPAPWKRA
jgi:hypothetical protein